MWDLRVILEINKVALENSRSGKDERDALFEVTGIRDVSRFNKYNFNRKVSKNIMFQNQKILKTQDTQM